MSTPPKVSAMTDKVANLNALEQMLDGLSTEQKKIAKDYLVGAFAKMTGSMVFAFLLKEAKEYAEKNKWTDKDIAEKIFKTKPWG